MDYLLKTKARLGRGQDAREHSRVGACASASRPSLPASQPSRRSLVGCPIPGLAPFLSARPILQFGFKQENILMMTDDCPDPLRRPTRANMFQARVAGWGGVRPHRLASSPALHATCL